MAFELRTAELESGLSLPYVEQGDANAAPVLLVHGYVESWRVRDAAAASALLDSHDRATPTSRRPGTVSWTLFS